MYQYTCDTLMESLSIQPLVAHFHKAVCRLYKSTTMILSALPISYPSFYYLDHFSPTLGSICSVRATEMRNIANEKIALAQELNACTFSHYKVSTRDHVRCFELCTGFHFEPLQILPTSDVLRDAFPATYSSSNIKS